MVPFVLSQHVDGANAAVGVLNIDEPLQLRRTRVVRIEPLTLEPLGLFKNLNIFLTQRITIGLMVQRRHVLNAGIGCREQTVHMIIADVLAR